MKELKNENMSQTTLDIFGLYGPIKYKKYGCGNMERKEIEKLDVTPYVGEKSEIVKAEVLSLRFGPVIKLETGPIPLKGNDSLPDGKIFRASLLLGLMTDDNGNYFIGIGTKLDKFIQAHKIDCKKIPDILAPGDLVHAFEGIKVICQKSATGFLEIC